MTFLTRRRIVFSAFPLEICINPLANAFPAQLVHSVTLPMQYFDYQWFYCSFGVWRVVNDFWLYSYAVLKILLSIELAYFRYSISMSRSRPVTIPAIRHCCWHWISFECAASVCSAMLPCRQSFPSIKNEHFCLSTISATNLKINCINYTRWYSAYEVTNK